MTRPPAALVAAVLLLSSCPKTEAGEAPKKSPKSVRFPVEVAPVEARRVEYTVFAVGSVEAFEQVQVTARVAGVVERVRFAEGETVAKGAVLAEVEPDRYRIAVEAARAALDKAEAAEPDLKAALARRQALVARTPGALAEEDLQSYETRAKVARAESAQARAALALAEVNLRDAYVRAPVGGVLQTRTVATGQYVEPGKVLATLLRRDPLLLRFEVPEQDAPRLKVGTAARFKVSGEAAERTASITHVAGAANPSSRMVAVVARTEDDPALRPGSFAEVKVRTGESDQAPAIPQTAIRPSERGFLAFVVEGEVARERVLALGMRTEDGRVEVKAGLAPGERLVVRGAEALKEGAQVRLDAGPAAAAPAPAPAPAPKAAP